MQPHLRHWHRTPGPLLVVLSIAAACVEEGPPADSREGDGADGADGIVLRGVIADRGGDPQPGVFVTAHDARRGTAWTVFTDDEGRYRLVALRPGTYRIEAQGHGFERAASEEIRLGESETELNFELGPDRLETQVPPSSPWLALLPDGDEKRRFLLDCTGCHQMGQSFVTKNGQPRSREEWAEAVRLMLSFAGPESSFPIIAPGREPEATAEWLSRYWGGPEASVAARQDAPQAGGPALSARITTYDLPRAGDLPHDLMLDGEGHVLITGMFTGLMYRLNPETGEFAEVPIPVPDANPRALEVAPDGTWWVLLGGPMKIARHNPASGEWRDYAIGTYPHSIARAGDGRLWYNAHFGRDPAWIASLEPTSGKITRYDIPPALSAPAGSPIPYEIRVGPDGSIWGSELAGNRVFRFSPETKKFTAYEMPTPHSGPRRLDVAPDGTVWIPEYAAGKLARLDPSTGRITEYAVPTRDALPYVARVDPRRGVVWITLAGADAIARFDPRTGSFVEIPLPVSPALIRHIDVEPGTGAIWAATSQAPPVRPTIMRIELPGEVQQAGKSLGRSSD